MNFNYNFSKLKDVLKNKSLCSDDHKIESLLYLENPYFKEKRKRLQIQESLNYYLSAFSSYDFFSSEVIEMLNQSKILTLILNTDTLTSDMVLHTIFDMKNNKVKRYFKQMNITKKKSERYLLKKWGQKKSLSDSLTFIDKLKNKFLKKITKIFRVNLISVKNEDMEKVEKVKFSEELLTIIDKAIKKANVVYKTPIVSLDIFLMTLLEEKGSHSRDLFINLIPDLRSLLQFRYKMLMHIYKTEKRLYNIIPKGLLVFDYLLRREFTSDLFCSMTFDPHIHYLRVLRYRNKLISKVLSYKYPEVVKSEIIKEILYKPKKIKNYELKNKNYI